MTLACFILQSIGITIKSTRKYEKCAGIRWEAFLIKTCKQKRIETEDRENCVENKRQMRYLVCVCIFQEMKISRFRSLQRS